MSVEETELWHQDFTASHYDVIVGRAAECCRCARGESDVDHGQRSMEIKRMGESRFLSIRSSVRLQLKSYGRETAGGNFPEGRKQGSIYAGELVNHSRNQICHMSVFFRPVCN